MLGAPRDPRQMYAITVGGTRNLLQAASEAGVRRVVHTSSVAALGVPAVPRSAVSPILIDETHTWNYRPAWWPYGHAKYLAELEVQKAVARGLDAVIVNPAIVLGAGDIHRVGGGIVIHMAQHGLPLAIAGGLNIIHIADVVRGHLAALERGRIGERYILAGENLTIASFLRHMAEVTGARPPRLVLPGGPVRLLAAPIGLLSNWLNLPVGEVLLRKAGYNFYYDAGKAHRELELGEMRPAREAIKDAYLWYQERGEVA
jgi:dihydroflavonol-4-reductase